MTRDLEIRHCRVLVAVHDNGGVAAAARVLGTAQSTVSETLLSLERLLGAPVMLRRTGREAKLTNRAEALLPQARALITMSQAALSSAAQHERATIKLGTVESISSFLLPRPLSEFRVLWPQIDVRITIGLCEDLRKRVECGELHVALTLEAAPVSQDQDCPSAAWPVPLFLVAAPHHPLARGALRRNDLSSQTCLLADPDGALNRIMELWSGPMPHPLKLQSAGSIDGVKRGVLQGDFVGVLPAYALVDELSARSLIALEMIDELPAIALRITTLHPLPLIFPLRNLVDGIMNVFQRSAQTNGADV